MWTLRESLTLLALSLLIGSVLVLTYLSDRIRGWWRDRRRRNRRL